MTSPVPDRVCTLCRTQFKERGARGVGCAVTFVVAAVLVAVAQGLRLDVLAQVGLAVVGLIVAPWAERRVVTARAQTCPSCGSRQTVPISSLAGVAVTGQQPTAQPEQPQASAIDPLTGVPQAREAPAAQPEAPQKMEPGQLILALVIAAAIVAWAVYQVWDVRF
jgi:hypothetical protein